MKHFETTLTMNYNSLSVSKLWRATDDGLVEAVVGPYKLYDSSFTTLQGSQWVSDEVTNFLQLIAVFLLFYVLILLHSFVHILGNRCLPTQPHPKAQGK